ncbi:hypothetical protein ACFL0F_00695 [Patescibacteria group bacterium]
MKGKITLIGLAVALLATLGAVGVNSVSADDATTFPPAIQALVDRFNLNEDEVGDVLDEVRTQRHEERHAYMGERLDGLVSEGKLTQEQKDKLLSRMEEMRENHEGWQYEDKEERMEAARQRKEEMQSWAEAEGIDLEEVSLRSGEGFKGGFGHEGKHFGF